MKKTIIVIISLFICIGVTVFLFVRDVQAKNEEAKNFNLQYEQYLGKELYGTDIGTLMNKVINYNEKQKISKDEKGLYLENQKEGIRIDVYIAENDTLYPMETIYQLGTTEFIKNFNTILFEAKVVAYHKETGKIAKILVEQK